LYLCNLPGALVIGTLKLTLLLLAISRNGCLASREPPPTKGQDGNDR
jgi:hypothetical protein